MKEVDKNGNEITEVKGAEVKTAEEPKAKKPNVFKRAWRGIKAGARKVRESPAATLIGVGIGAIGAGAAMAVTHLVSSRAFAEDETDATEVIEQEFEDDPETVDEPAEEVQEEVA